MIGKKLLCKKDFCDLKSNCFYTMNDYDGDIVEFEESRVVLSKSIKHKYYLWCYFYTTKELRKKKLDKLFK